MSGTSADAAGLEPANPSVNGRTRYLLRHTSIFLYGQNLHPPTTYSQGHMLNDTASYARVYQHDVRAKQAKACDAERAVPRPSMEHTGIEPAASCLQNRRRPIATNAPYSPAAFLPAYLTYLLYTFSTPSSNLTVILSGYPDWSDVYGRCLILTIFPSFL